MEETDRQNVIEGGMGEKKKKRHFDAKDDEEAIVIGSFKQGEVDSKNLNRSNQVQTASVINVDLKI